ncbi:MAG: phospholipase D family protein [Verrucomicrobiota bacterium]
MSFRLIDSNWDKEFATALGPAPASIKVLVPFIKVRAAKRLLAKGRPRQLLVITRFNLDDFSSGVSDIAALNLLLRAGARIRGVRNLHAKLYLFDDCRAIVTSANLTEAALTRNHEFGFFSDDQSAMTPCHAYFDNLWNRAGPDLLSARIQVWQGKVSAYLATASVRALPPALGDDGIDAGIQGSPFPLPARVAESGSAFVKFFGTSKDRAPLALPVLQELDESGSHWSCNHPRNKRPRQVKEGDTIFVSRMVQGGDMIIYGRATAYRYVAGRDDACPAEVIRHDFKKKWPHYIRTHSGQFLNGSLANGISLNRLMAVLGPLAFQTTKARMATSPKAVNPRTAYKRAPGVELSSEGTIWMNQELESAFATHGTLLPNELGSLHWPILPAGLHY